MTKGKPLVNTDQEAFARDWNTYTSLQEMAEKYGVNTSAVSHHARKIGLRPRLTRKKNR